ncbi:YegP family protein [Arthrobacter sp. SAFR-014]|uniref:YegP family protein n=1 Tax=unclassified Arthrobacter TaxID=235627 RepID=UPI003F7BA0EB
MAGYFELVDAPDGGYRIRLLDGSGALMAVSVTFPTKRAAVAGVAQAREIAGTGLIRDRCKDAVKRPAPKRHGKPARQAMKSTVGIGYGSPRAASHRVPGSDRVPAPMLAEH